MVVVAVEDHLLKDPLTFEDVTVLSAHRVEGMNLLASFDSSVAIGNSDCEVGEMRVASRRKFLLVLAFGGAAWLAACLPLLAQSNLTKGTFRGCIQIGNRPFLSSYLAGIRAFSTNPTGYTSFAVVDVTDPVCNPLPGYEISVEATDPGNPDPGNRIVWTLYTYEGYPLATTSGQNDVDRTMFPPAVGLTVDPEATRIVNFKDPDPWILDVTIINEGCAGAIYGNSVSASSPDAAVSYTSDASDGLCQVGTQSYPCKTLDMPLLSETDRSYSVTLDIQSLGTCICQPVRYGPFIVGPNTAYPPDGNGHIALEIPVQVPCTTCASAHGELRVHMADLMSRVPPEVTTSSQGYIEFAATSGQRPYSQFPLILSGSDLVGNYTIDGQICPSPEKYTPRAFGSFPYGLPYGESTGWPNSTMTPAPDPSGFESFSPGQDRQFDWEISPALIKGTTSFRCMGNRPFDPGMVDIKHTYFLGSGSVGLGVSRPVPNLDYWALVHPGTWTPSDGLRTHHMELFKDTPEEYVDQNYLDIKDTRGSLQVPAPGDVATLNFSYGLTKLTQRLTVSGGTQQLRYPQLAARGVATDSGGNIEYTISDVNGFGRNVLALKGDVTIYLPRGRYTVYPYAVVEDGSSPSFPPFEFEARGCEGIDCDLGAPLADWQPLPDTCGVVSISGNATDQDGWGHVRYRLNNPGGEDPSPSPIGYIEIDKNFIDSENITFSKAIPSGMLQPGDNVIELETLDALGNRCWNVRRVVPIDSTPPTLSWSFTTPGPVGCPPTIEIQGTVDGTSLLEPEFQITVNGNVVTRQLLFGQQGSRTAGISETIPLQAGLNNVIVMVEDVCGNPAVQSHTVTVADSDQDGLGDACDADDDNDGELDATDCASIDRDTYHGAPEINDGKDNQCGPCSSDFGFGAIDEITGASGFRIGGQFCWPAQQGATGYEVWRSPTGYFGVCNILPSNLIAPSGGNFCIPDSENPPTGGVFNYVVRATGPNVGSWGQASDCVERVGICPRNFVRSDVQPTDDIAPTDLLDFFNALPMAEQVFILVTVNRGGFMRGFCADSAAAYVSDYIALAAGSGSPDSTGRTKYPFDGLWSPQTTAAYLNRYGASCLRAGAFPNYAWCPEEGMLLNGLDVTLVPSSPDACEAYWGTCNAADPPRLLTVRVGPVRRHVCGF